MESPDHRAWSLTKHADCTGAGIDATERTTDVRCQANDLKFA